MVIDVCMLLLGTSSHCPRSCVPHPCSAKHHRGSSCSVLALLQATPTSWLRHFEKFIEAPAHSLPPLREEALVSIDPEERGICGNTLSLEGG